MRVVACSLCAARRSHLLLHGARLLLVRCLDHPQPELQLLVRLSRAEVGRHRGVANVFWLARKLTQVSAGSFYLPLTLVGP